MQDFKTLVVWQKAHELTLKIYKLTKTFPSDERSGLISQMQHDQWLNGNFYKMFTEHHVSSLCFSASSDKSVQRAGDFLFVDRFTLTGKHGCWLKF